MRKAFSLVEMVVVISILAILSPAFARLSSTFLNEVPRSYRVFEQNENVLRVLARMQEDIESAKRLPNSFEQYKSDEKTLLIELPDGLICYELKDNQMTRKKIHGEISETWKLDHGKIKWRLLQKDDKNHAVEIENYVEQKIEGRLKKKLANSHIYFAGLWHGVTK